MVVTKVIELFRLLKNSSTKIACYTRPVIIFKFFGQPCNIPELFNAGRGDCQGDQKMYF